MLISCFLHDLADFGASRGFGTPVADQLDCGHQSVPAAHIADDVVLFQQRQTAFVKLRATGGGIFDDVASSFL